MGVSNTGFIQVVREKILSISSVTDIVSSRVFSTHFIDYETATTQFPCVIIERLGGDSTYAESFQKIKFAIYCYSKVSAGEALSIYDTVFSELNGTRLYIDGLAIKGYCFETERPIEDYNIVCKGWYAKGRFLSYNAS